ncbi:sorting nexin-31 isoform X6 [Cavia porcellus]|uniref:sorting nexin-31 isoform X6 n=1 Tax=Cavia porcellus TaxID=10141 RepID=UPI002FE2C4D1
MKTHFSIPVSQQRPDALGGRYVVRLGPRRGQVLCPLSHTLLTQSLCLQLYSVYLDGFLFCRVRYSQLHRWNEQLRRVFGNCLPPFPPKYYLAMTESMAEERRNQLEQYLQNVTADPNVLRSDVFTEFLKLAQLNTFNITAEKAFLDIFLPNGRSINVEILTSATAERVLEVVSHKVGLSRELSSYFGLFLMQSYKEGSLSVVKMLAEFELPYASLRSSELENCKVGLRKWYMDPALDSILMACGAAVELLYMQAVQDIEKEWIKPTQAQRQQLDALQKENNQTKGTLLDMEQTLNQNLELRFQFSEGSCWQWFVIYTKQAFLLSSCLKKMITEKMAKLAAEGPKMQIEVPEKNRSEKDHIRQSKQKEYSSFLSRKSKVNRGKDDYVFGTITEEDL